MSPIQLAAQAASTAETGWKQASFQVDMPIKILLVEDVSSDALLTRRALESTGIAFSLTKSERGDEALSRLCSDQRICPSQMPDLLMLDLGLPGIDGFEVLAEMAQMPLSIRSVPIVVLTSHTNFEYIRQNFPLCVMAYINKPCQTAELTHILQQVQAWKVSCATL